MRILICPLDWGLGHATRCIPLIRALGQAGHEVILYATGPGRKLLQSEFPDQEVGELPGYSMRYSRSALLLPLKLFAQLPQFVLSALRERWRLRGLIRKHKIDRVVSDGRYGLHSRKVPCFFVSHQLRIIPPGPRWLRTKLSGPLLRLNRWALKGFAEIWVPDFSGAPNLSGRLGHPDPAWPNVRYIGPLCRFRPESLSWDRFISPDAPGSRIDVLALLSGPEPQRSALEKKLLDGLLKISGTRVLLRGLPGNVNPGGEGVAPGGLTVVDHVPERMLQSYLERAEKVVCRSGYTTVMELAGLRKKHVLLIPTPGQPEQEYLAEHLRGLGIPSQEQEKMDLRAGLKDPGPGFSAFFADELGKKTDPLSTFIKRHPLLRSDV